MFRIFGPPGTGKTTELLNMVDKALSEDISPHRIAQRLRDINGDATSLKIKGKAVRVWTIPAYELGSGSIAVPDMGQQEKAPF